MYKQKQVNYFPERGEQKEKEKKIGETTHLSQMVCLTLLATS